MKTINLLCSTLLILSLLSVLISCDQPRDEVNVNRLDLIGESQKNAPTAVLLREFWKKRSVKGGELYETDGMTYLPRKFTSGIILHSIQKSLRVRVLDAGIFKGWDVLKIVDKLKANERYQPGTDFLYLNLRRPATIGVVFYGSRNRAPRWLSDWAYKGDIEVNYERGVYPVFTKVFKEGKHYLEPLGQKGLMYSVLLAEADGLPSSPPLVSEGLELPVSNVTCPSWLHDSYLTKDGHATWHPQIDPTYWCSFGHDHGSNPDTFAGDWQPRFNRYSRADEHEEHEGYKVFIFNDDHHSAMITLHAGSSDYRRLCTRMHTFDVVIAERNTGEILGNFAFKGDFGVSRAQVGFTKIGPMAPTRCPENVFIKGSAGSRSVPIYPETGYESWRVDLETAAALPLTGGGAFRIDEPLTVCSNSQDIDKLYSCDRLIKVSEHSGARHWFDLFGGFGMDTTKYRALSGVFCTDYLGAVLLACEDANSVKQYAKPNTKVEFLNIRAFVRNPWKANYVSNGTFVRTYLNLEQSLSSPN